MEKSPTTPVAETKVELFNKPLNFQLKGIDCGHPYLKERGLTAETIEMFGVGYFAGKGSMTGRVVIPIHDEAGQHVVLDINVYTEDAEAFSTEERLCTGIEVMRDLKNEYFERSITDKTRALFGHKEDY